MKSLREVELELIAAFVEVERSDNSKAKDFTQKRRLAEFKKDCQQIRVSQEDMKDAFDIG